MPCLKQTAVVAGVCALSLGGYLFHWLRTPRIENPELHEEIWKAANERHEHYQAHALDPRKNLYLNPTFLPYWGVEKDRIKRCSTERAVAAWISDGEGHDDYIHIPEFPSYREAKARFEDLINQLSEESHKPVFVVPGELWSRRQSMDTSNLRRLLYGTIKLAESRVYHDDDVEGALEILLFCFKLFDKVGRGNSRIDWLYSRTSQSITVKALTDLFKPEDLEREKWLEVAGVVSEVLTSDDDFLIALEDETAQLRLTTRRGLSPEEWGEGFDPYERFQALRARDERILCNEMTPLLLSVKSGGPPRYGKARRGHKGICVFPPGQFQLDIFQQSAYLCRRHLLGLLGTASLLGGRDEKGRLPARVDIEDGRWEHDKSELFVPLNRSRVTQSWLEFQGEEEDEDPESWLEFKPDSGWDWKLG